MADGVVVDLGLYRLVRERVAQEADRVAAVVPKHRNPDGTYNGAAALAELSGLDEREVRWMYRRTRALLDEGLPLDTARARVREEAPLKPWRWGA